MKAVFDANRIRPPRTAPLFVVEAWQRAEMFDAAIAGSSQAIQRFADMKIRISASAESAIKGMQDLGKALAELGGK